MFHYLFGLALVFLGVLRVGAILAFVLTQTLTIIVLYALIYAVFTFASDVYIVTGTG
ncbi:hypothetical protein J2754_003049 [Halarchaeum solikamskense]|nr:hypothetical protein [Halarchaeum solikamskense]